LGRIGVFVADDSGSLPSGTLLREIIEPGNSEYCLVTNCWYDGYGNSTFASKQ